MAHTCVDAVLGSIDPTKAVMRAVSASARAFPSEMFYEGRVKNANTVSKPYQPNILLVTWTHDGSQPDGFPAPFEAALAAELFTSLQFDPKEDSIITFYGAQRKAISSALRDNRVCRIVDSSQGSVVEGFPDPAVFLFI